MAEIPGGSISTFSGESAGNLSAGGMPRTINGRRIHSRRAARSQYARTASGGTKTCISQKSVLRDQRRYETMEPFIKKRDPAFTGKRPTCDNLYTPIEEVIICLKDGRKIRLTEENVEKILSHRISKYGGSESISENPYFEDFFRAIHPIPDGRPRELVSGPELIKNPETIEDCEENAKRLYHYHRGE